MRRCGGAEPGISGFNEAGAKKPRKGQLVKPSCLTENCFNEAGAKKPRKGDTGSPPPRDARCFNEAGAKKPRKGLPTT